MTLNTSINSVLFPALSLCQDDYSRLKQLTRRAVQMSSFVLSPVLLGLAAVAPEVISLILTDKWLPCVPYLQIYCLIYLLQPIQSSGLQCMKAVGRSDLNFKLQIIKSLFGLVTVIISVFFMDGITVIVISALIAETFATIINTPVNHKLIGYRYTEQFIDAFKSIIIAGIMYVIVYFMKDIPLPIVLRLILKTITGVVVYTTLSFIFQKKEFKYLLNAIASLLKRKKNQL